jgi:hypothetical protein
MTDPKHPTEDQRPHPDRPETWPLYRPLIIAHDVGHVRDRSTAVVGGGSPFQSSVSGILEARELPQGLYGSARASALAAVDRQYGSNALIVADLSNEPSYGEFLYETFGPRVIGLQITRHGAGMDAERRPVGRGAMLIYTIGRTQLIDYFHSLMTTDMVRLAQGPEIKRAFAQFNNLQAEMRDTGRVYSCLPGHHDDLAISCCMLAWACRHPHLRSWSTTAFADRLPRPTPPKFNWGAACC